MHTDDLDGQRNATQRRAPEWDAARRVLRNAVPQRDVEGELLRAFARRHPPKPWYRRWSFEALTPWASLGAIGCMVAIVVAGVQSADPLQAARPDMVATVASDGFLSLTSAERIRTAVNPQLKQANISRETLVQMGIPIAADAPEELVHAELLVAASGEALAVRLAVN